MNDKWLMQILQDNADRSFVKRILYRDKYPVLENPDGSVSTHSMSWGEVDGRYVAYPTVMTTKDGLRRFGADEAWGHAMRSNNYIEFATPEEADWFSKNYKRVWK